MLLKPDSHRTFESLAFIFLSMQVKHFSPKVATFSLILTYYRRKSSILWIILTIRFLVIVLCVNSLDLIYLTEKSAFCWESMSTLMGRVFGLKTYAWWNAYKISVEISLFDLRPSVQNLSCKLVFILCFFVVPLIAMIWTWD